MKGVLSLMRQRLGLSRTAVQNSDLPADPHSSSTTESNALAGELVESLRSYFVSEIDRQRQSGLEHSVDPYWTDLSTGHNVGEDELQAVRFMEAIASMAGCGEVETPAAYAIRILEALQESRARFRLIESDPDGYGSATFGEVIVAIEKRCADMRIELAAIEVPSSPDTDWFELERHLNDAKAQALALVRQKNVFLLMDQIQVAIFLTLIRVYRGRESLSDAEIAYYSKDLYELRSIAMLGIETVPRILLGSFYRYIIGMSNSVSILRTEIPESGQDEDILPFTCFGFDFEAGKRALTEQGAGSAVYRHTDDTPHAIILIGLNYLESIASPSECAFLQQIFRDPTQTILGSDKEIIYHYLEANFLRENDSGQDDGTKLFCFAVRSRENGSLAVSGWNCGPTAAISRDIHQLALMAAFGAATTQGKLDNEAENLLFRLSHLLRPEREQEPADDERVSILAEGPVALFPFAALKLRDGSTLSARAPVTMLLNSSSKASPREGVKDFTPAIVISVADHDLDGNMAALPAAGSEGAAIARLWKCDNLEGDAAGPEIIAQMLGQYALVHIATHGLVRGPLRHLDRALAATDPVAFLNEAEAAMDAAALVAGGLDVDGSLSLLSGQEIRRLDLSGTNLVFLSLCGGASVRAVGGEASFGLSQSLVRAGVKMVIATLFPVADTVAYAFGTQFHGYLVSGLAPADALRQTQLAMADDGHGWHCWGGYQLLV